MTKPLKKNKKIVETGASDSGNLYVIDETMRLVPKTDYESTHGTTEKRRHYKFTEPTGIESKPKSPNKRPNYQIRSLYGRILYEGDTLPNKEEQKKIAELERAEKIRKQREQSKNKGGKKSRKLRKKRKMKGGGSLVGTDLITGLNTTNTNSVIAFGTTGGTEYMYNTLAGKSIDSGPYMSPETPVEPVLA